jgi:hypothetical protein
MDYESALKKIEGADSVGGDLIVVREGKHIVVGKNVQGTLIVADTDEARAVMVEIGVHAVVVDDKVETEDDPNPKHKK